MSNSIENISNATVSDVFSSYTSLITHTRGNLFEGLGYETVKNDHLYNKAYFSSTEVIDEKNILEKISKAQKIIQNLSTLKGKIDSIEVLNDEQKQVLQGMIQKNIW
ncbi:MAG: hypothetical protein LBD75_06615 [Candidatus Peribacteria bacterium]|jgi:hypothetical protein|nr:hypothetical protein [Candidatus Peribacteria bacterium]